jgi:hypothetical protein
MTPEKLQEIWDRENRKFGHWQYHNLLMCQQDRKNLLQYVAELESRVEYLENMIEFPEDDVTEFSDDDMTQDCLLEDEFEEQNS